MQPAGDGDPLSELERQLTQADPAMAQRMNRPLTRQITVRLAVSGSMAAAGFLILIYGTRPLGLGAVLPGCLLVYIGGFDFPMRILQLRRHRDRHRDPG